MYQPYGEATLRSGEKVEAGVVLGPDADWRGRILEILAHKPPIWLWQMDQFLTQTSGMEARMHMLHRDGVPFCHILTCEFRGAGLLGHVWTVPLDRGQAAASILLTRLLENFRERGGKAMYLGTGFESDASRIYSKHGFNVVEPRSGVMAWFADGVEEFEKNWFQGVGEVQPLGWPHYAAASSLLASDVPGTVRGAPLGLLGRTLTEEGLLKPLKTQADAPDEAPRVQILQLETGAVAGLSCWGSYDAWPGTVAVDVFCHPHYWARAGELLERLTLPTRERTIAFAEVGFQEKRTVLEAAGFHEIAKLPRWAARDAARAELLDVLISHRD